MLLKERKSLHQLLGTLYKGIQWDPNKFVTAAARNQKRRESHLTTLMQIQEKLGIQHV